MTHFKKYYSQNTLLNSVTEFQTQLEIQRETQLNYNSINIKSDLQLSTSKILTLLSYTLQFSVCVEKSFLHLGHMAYKKSTHTNFAKVA